MRRLALLLLVSACKESGPPPPDPAVVRQKLCRERAPKVKQQWDQQNAALKLAREAAPVKTDAPGPLKLRALHPGDSGATVDAIYLATADGLITRCEKELEKCDSDEVERALDKCAGLDAVLVIKPSLDEPVKVEEAMLNKYKGGHVAGEALLFGLGDLFPRAAFTFDVKLHGGVEVERDAPTGDREKVVNEALRKQVLEGIEEKSTR
jgi:hypothetical protein